MELKIYFKNVGQGDTIIIEWAESAKSRTKKYGMVDCNLVDNGIMPVIQHILEKKIKVFEFVIMSHPHTDHFSGMLPFLDYCGLNKIRIKSFIHTASFEPNYLAQIIGDNVDKGNFKRHLTLSVNSARNKMALYKLYKILRRNHNDPTSFIDHVKIASDGSILELTNDVKLRFWAPGSYDEMQQYFLKTYNASDEEKRLILRELANNPHANMLSSFLQLYSEQNDWQVLLCADLTTFTLRKILGRPALKKELSKKKLIAAQIPHHGSIVNHNEDFWHIFKNLKKAHIIISVGLGFGHPNKTVIDYFKQKCAKVHATNFVGGYKESFSPSLKSSARLLQNTIGMAGVAFRKPLISSYPSSKVPTCGEKCLVINSGKNFCRYDVIDI